MFASLIWLVLRRGNTMTNSDANTSPSLIQGKKSRSPLQFCKWLICTNLLSLAHTRARIETVPAARTDGIVGFGRLLEDFRGKPNSATVRYPNCTPRDGFGAS